MSAAHNRNVNAQREQSTLNEIAAVGLVAGKVRAVPAFGSLVRYEARLISIVSWMKPRNASLSKGLRKIFKSGGAAWAASL